MESYKPKNKLPAVARSTASRNSTDFESKNADGGLHLPSINDIQSHHSSEEPVMSKEEVTKIKNNKNLKSYLGKDFNYNKGRNLENEYNIQFRSHRKQKFDQIKADREQLAQRQI